MANFSHRHFCSASLHYLMSIRAIDPVNPQRILPMSVTLFPSGMLSIKKTVTTFYFVKN